MSVCCDSYGFDTKLCPKQAARSVDSGPTVRSSRRLRRTCATSSRIRVGAPKRAAGTSRSCPDRHAMARGEQGPDRKSGLYWTGSFGALYSTALTCPHRHVQPHSEHPSRHMTSGKAARGDPNGRPMLTRRADATGRPDFTNDVSDTSHWKRHSAFAVSDNSERALKSPGPIHQARGRVGWCQRATGPPCPCIRMA